ncbi:hypothetical protein [Flavobacterium sp. FlaQc-30]|uniref:hypothetical protein n=1 Tax=Flavobacterium sp. FlaQc-30 TaxID=3374179 RepID=UPI003756DCD4
MKNYLIMILILFSLISCKSQETELFTVFGKELNNTLFTAKVNDKTSIVIEENNDKLNEKIKVTEQLQSTTRQNIYFFQSNGLDSRKIKGLTVAEFIENDNVLCIYIDTIFANKEQVKKFISKPMNLEMAIPIYFVKNITLKQVNRMPTIKNISAEDLKTLKERNNQRVERLKLLPENLDDFTKLKLYMKQQTWLNTQCLLLGYKFPLTSDEHKWLISEINKQCYYKK